VQNKNATKRKFWDSKGHTTKRRPLFCKLRNWQIFHSGWHAC